MLVSFVAPGIVEAAIVSSTVSSSTTSITTTKISEPLVPFVGTVSSTSLPPPSKTVGADRGTNKIFYSGSAINLERDSGSITISPVMQASSGITATQLIPTATLKNSSTIVFPYSAFLGPCLVSESLIIKNTTDPYSREIIFKDTGTTCGLSTQSIQLSSPRGLPASVCDSLSHQIIKNGSKITIGPCTKQCFGTGCFDWTKDAASYNNVTKIVTFTLSPGFAIDPLALDGSGTGSCGSSTTCTVTLTTSNINDVIIVSCGCYTSTTTFTIADVAGLTWTSRASTGNFGGNTKELEWYAIATGTLSADVITITGCGGCYYGIVANGVTGADVSSPPTSVFDGHANVPLTDNNDAGCPTSGGNFYPCVTGFSTSNADDFIEVSCSDTGNNDIGAGTGMTLIGQNFGQPQNGYAEYKIVSSAQTAQTFSFDTTYIGNTYGCIADAIKQNSGAAAPRILVLKVNTVSGGGICCITASSTISSSTTLTYSSNTTFAVTAEEFASYIWFGWAGATTLIGDTINPVQTVTISSPTLTTTVSDTLTAQFSKTGAGGGTSVIVPQNNVPLILSAFAIILALAGLMLVYRR